MMAWAWEREGGGRGRDKLSYRSTTNGGAYLVIENDDDVRSYVLRGCMGTLSTTGLPLDDALSRYATTSAFNDVRFDPIRYDELPYLRVSVSLLVNYETCANCRDWIVGVHGIIIEFVGGGAGGEDRGRRRGDGGGGTRRYTAKYLPEVAHDRGWDQEEAVISLIRKSGYTGEVTQRLLSDVCCTRYRSSIHHSSYREYYHRAVSSSGRGGGNDGDDDDARRRRRRRRRRQGRRDVDDAGETDRSSFDARWGGRGGAGGNAVDFDVDDDGRMMRRKSRTLTGSPSCVNL